MKNNTKKIAGLLVIAVIALAGVWFFNYTTTDDPVVIETVQSQEVTEETPNVEISEDGELVSYEGVEGLSALALLKQYTNAQTEEFTGLGEYVVGINDIVADSTENYWSFYVNGNAAQVGAGDYITSDGDKIEWRLEDVSTFDQ